MMDVCAAETLREHGTLALRDHSEPALSRADPHPPHGIGAGPGTDGARNRLQAGLRRASGPCRNIFSAPLPAPPMSTQQLLIAGAIVFGASLLRGLSGFGFSLVAAPLFTLLWAPAQAIPMAILMQALSAVPAFIHQRSDASWPIVTRVAAGSILGILPGAALLFWLAPQATRLIMAGLLLTALGLLAFGIRLRKPLAVRNYWYVGMVAGGAQMLSGAAGPPVIVALLASRDLDATVTRATLTATFLLTGLIGLVPFIASGGVNALPPASDIAALCLPLLAGYWAGDRVFRLTADINYRRIALAVLLGAVLLMLKPLVI